MSQQTEVLQAVAVLVRDGRVQFSPRDVREQLGIANARQGNSYDAAFQTMREDRAEADRNVGIAMYRGVLRQIEPGIYELTDYGARLIRELNF
jgi:hypothetical protein